MKKMIGIYLLTTVLFVSNSFAEEVHQTETFVGIGATLEKRADGTVKVDGLIANAPAEKAGVLVGDLIDEVKSLPTSATVDVRAMQLPDVVALIRGPIGVPVEITLTREGGESAVLSIVRDKFDVNEGH